jgi:hypothetical protein
MQPCRRHALPNCPNAGAHKRWERFTKDSPEQLATKGCTHLPTTAHRRHDTRHLSPHAHTLPALVTDPLLTYIVVDDVPGHGPGRPDLHCGALLCTCSRGPTPPGPRLGLLQAASRGGPGGLHHIAAHRHLFRRRGGGRGAS